MLRGNVHTEVLEGLQELFWINVSLKRHKDIVRKRYLSLQVNYR